MKEKFILASMLAVYGPCIWPPQSQLIEMAFICKDKLVRAEMGSDEVPILLMVLLVMLKSTTCDL